MDTEEYSNEDDTTEDYEYIKVEKCKEDEVRCNLCKCPTDKDDHYRFYVGMILYRLCPFCFSGVMDMATFCLREDED